jgi:uncharacterized protein (DUF608 family)
MSQYSAAGTGRRGFLKTAALGAAAAPATAQPPAPKPQPTAAAPAPFEYPRTFRGRQLSMIAFPLGGVGAGSVSLGGRGELRDWEIFNRPNKGGLLRYSFPAIWAQAGSGRPVARVLEARLNPPYHAARGLHPAQVSGLTRLDEARFTGEFPLATVAFRDRTLPVKVTLEAFTPFIPLEPDDSGLPVAILRYRVSNPGKAPAKVSIAWSIDNPVGVDPRGRRGESARTAEFRSAPGLDGLMMTDSKAAPTAPMFGSLALCVLNAGQDKVTHLRGWQRAKWWASPLLFWDDFSTDGLLGPEPESRNTVGSLCLQRSIAPGAEADFTFLLAWHFPNRTPAWCGWDAPQGEENTIIGNYYARRFADAWKVAEYTASHLESLEKRTRSFAAAMRASTLPPAVKDAAMSNLSTLVTNTCFRTADGKFRFFEGIDDQLGCCHGNCTHVWNYEVALEHLFPSLARSMRESAFELGSKLGGVIPIRIALPEGKQTGGTTAADGTMGQIIKAFLDWRLSGDQDWLRRIWPQVKQAMAFAWVEGGWDGNRDGVAEGVQHNTYDVEFYGPNPMCGVYYLGGLRACQEMAKAVGDEDFARRCAGLFSSGSRWIDANLFNGRHYVQKIQGIPLERIAKPLRSTGGAKDPEHPDFQLGEGCLTDQLIGQYLADLAGLGPLLNPSNMRKTFESIYRYNHRANLEKHDSVERIYALNDEAAMLICDYAPGKRPRIPFPYASEAWTGIEYLIGTQFIFAGMIREGVQCFEDARRRYDGEKRNPWDEIECGHHYVRAMAAWSGILALSGFRYHGGDKSLIVTPRTRPESFTSFWSTGTAWGTFTHSIREGRTRLAVSVTEGKLPCRSVQLAAAGTGAATARLGNRAVAHQLHREAKHARFEFSETLEVAEGATLTLTV